MTEEQLALRARRLREHIICMLEKAGSGHSAGALGLADIFAVLFFEVLRYDPHKPYWPDRDRLVLSAGHTCPVLYAALAEAGCIERKELLSLRQLSSRLQGHPHNRSLSYIEASSGPLGQGLSQAIGMALAARSDQASWRTFAVLSDGEHQEGQTWEAILFAAHYHLENLTVIVDRNYIQIDGPTENILSLESLEEKYRAFHWNVLSIPGNSLPEIRQAFASLPATNHQPTCIIAHTTPGKGVEFMENDFHWHGKAPTTDQANQALEQLLKY